MTRSVCETPADFRAVGGKSVHGLLKASGYLKHRDFLTRDAVDRYVRGHPEVVAAWQQYSEDKRTNGGWYFTTDASDVEVGYFDARHGVRDVQQYPSREEACTEFILKEVHEIARGSTSCLWWVIGALLVVIAWVVMVFQSLQ